MALYKTNLELSKNQFLTMKGAHKNLHTYKSKLLVKRVKGQPVSQSVSQLVSQIIEYRAAASQLQIFKIFQLLLYLNRFIHPKILQ